MRSGLLPCFALLLLAAQTAKVAATPEYTQYTTRCNDDVPSRITLAPEDALLVKIPSRPYECVYAVASLQFDIILPNGYPDDDAEYDDAWAVDIFVWKGMPSAERIGTSQQLFADKEETMYLGKHCDLIAAWEIGSTTHTVDCIFPEPSDMWFTNNDNTTDHFIGVRVRNTKLPHLTNLDVATCGGAPSSALWYVTNATSAEWVDMHEAPVSEVRFEITAVVHEGEEEEDDGDTNDEQEPTSEVTPVVTEGDTFGEDDPETDTPIAPPTSTAIHTQIEAPFIVATDETDSPSILQTPVTPAVIGSAMASFAGTILIAVAGIHHLRKRRLLKLESDYRKQLQAPIDNDDEYADPGDGAILLSTFRRGHASSGSDEEDDDDIVVDAETYDSMEVLDEDGTTHVPPSHGKSD